MSGADHTDNAARRSYFGLLETCDGLYEFEVGEVAPDDPWPGMVRFEFVSGTDVVGGTLTIDDARELASHLGVAAELASLATREARTK